MDLGRRVRAVGARAQNLRVALGVLAILSAPATPSYAAFSGFTGADSKSILEACSTERTPLLDRQKQYAALRRERVTAATVASAKVGAKVLLASGLLGLVLGGGATGILSKALSMKSQASGNKAQDDSADYAHAFQAISVVVAIGGA